MRNIVMTAEGVARARSRRRQRGLTLIETAVALGVLALMMVSLGNITTEYQQAARSRATAIQLNQVTQAASQYVTSNFATVLAQTPVGGGVAYVAATGNNNGTGGMQSLQQAGMLPASFADRNPYGQQSYVLLRQPTAGRIEALVTTAGGQTIPDRQLGGIATATGASGGFVASSPVGGATAQTIQGAYGGWRSTTTTWQGAPVAPTAGRVMSTLAFQNGALLQDFLYRHDVGDPTANTMYTSINMNNNNLNGVNTLTAGSGTMAINMNTGSIANLGAISAAGGQLDVTGGLHATQAVTSGSDMTAANNVTATGGNVSATAGNLTAGNVNSAGSTGSVLVEKDVVAGGNGSVAGDLDVGQRVVARGDIVGKRYIDADNVAFQADPYGLSNMVALNPIMLNADAYLYGASVKRPVGAVDPRTLPAGTPQSTVDAYQAAYYNEVEGYDPTRCGGGPCSTTMPAIKLGDLLPRFVVKGMYVVQSDGKVTLADGTTLCSPSTSPTCNGWVPQPTCTNGTSQLYLSKVDDSFTFTPPLSTSAGIVGVTGQAQGPTSLYPVTGQTVQNVVTDVRVGSVSMASNALISAAGACPALHKSTDVNQSCWGVSIDTTSQYSAVPRRVLAQTLCSFDF